MNKLNKFFAHFLLWNVMSLVFGELDAETIYKFLSGRIDDFSFETRTTVVNIDRRIKTVKENVNQLMSAIQQYTVNEKQVASGQEAIVDFKESINFQDLAVWKTLTKEKTLLRESVKQVNTHFYEFRENIQKQMSNFFETVTNQLLARNNSIEVTSTEIVTLNDVVRKTSVDTRKDIEQLSSTIISESEDLRRSLEELKRDLKAEIEQINLKLKSVFAKSQESTGIDNSGFFGPGTIGVVTGWWSTDYMGYDIHDILQQTQVQIKSDEGCTAGLDYYERAQINLTQMFCAGGQVTIDGIQTNLDACTGSVGSPFIVENPVKRNTYIQTGIASFGFEYGCRQDDKYGFFTRLTKELLNWIQETMYKH